MAEATHSGRRDVRKVGSNTGSVDDIVEREVIDQGARLEKEGEGLANSSRGTCDDCGIHISHCIIILRG